MAYKALYRSYRPNNFAEVVGQSHVTQTLQNAIMYNKTSHAYIFSGPRGVGKTTIARIFARAINCENPQNGEPCNKCPKCEAILNEVTTDIIELDAASNNGVDEMRRILEKVNFLPSLLKTKVYIIDEVHMLSLPAFNALLKTLEEPPLHVCFIFATTEPHKIPLTIHSRCQRFDFKPLTKAQIVMMLNRVIEREGILIKDEAVEGIAEAAEGGMRDALGMLDQVSAFTDDEITIEDVDKVTGRVSKVKLLELLSSFESKDVTNSLSIIEELVESGKEVDRITYGLIQLCRDLLLYQTQGNALSKKAVFDDEKFIALAKSLKRMQILKYLDILIDIQNKMKWTTSQMIYLEVGIMKMIHYQDETPVVQEIDIEKSETIAILEESICDLERNVQSLEAKFANQNIKDWQESVNAKLEFLENRVSNTTYNKEIENRILELEDAQKRLQVEFEDKMGIVEVIGDALREIKADVEAVKTTKPAENDVQTGNNINETNEELLTRLTSLENQVAALSEKAQKVQPKADEELLAKLTELESRISVIKENVKEEPNPINSDLLERIEKIESKVTNILGAKPEQSQEPSNLFIANTQEMMMQLQNRIDDMDSLVQLIMGKFNGVEERLDIVELYHNEEKPHSEEVINEIKDQYNELKQQFEHYQDAVEAFQLAYRSEIDGLVKRIDDLAEKAEKKEETPALDATVLDELSKSINNVKEYSFKLGARINQLEEAMKKAPAEVPAAPETVPQVQAAPQPQTQTSPTTVVVRTPRAESETVAPVTAEEIDDLETQRVYDVKRIETILHESRDQKAREEKVKIVNNWRRMGDKLSLHLTPVARYLMDGVLAANGLKEMIIVYPNAQICNYLMEEKVHLDAKQVLKNAFGKEYDFIALPESVWQDKRKEYHSQYYMGVKYPKLSPINHPELKIMKTDKSLTTPKVNSIDQKAEALFGKALIRKEGE